MPVLIQLILWSNFSPLSYLAGAAHPDYLPAALLANQDDMTATWQANLFQPVIDWQPPPACTQSCLTSLHSSICHFSSSIQSPIPPTPPLYSQAICLCTRTKRKKPREAVSCLAVLTPWIKAMTIGTCSVTPGRPTFGKAVTIKSSSLSGLQRMKKRAVEQLTPLQHENMPGADKM